MNTKHTDRLELVKEFRTIPLFSALDEAQLMRVIVRVSRVELKPGNTLFLKDEPAEYFYYLEKGQIQLFLESEDGYEKIIDVVHSGQIFAEAVTFFAGQYYPLSAVAIQPSTLLAISIPVFRSILRESVDTCFRLMAALSQRLHIQLTEINNLALHNATYRLVNYLLKSIPEKQDKEIQITLDYPKNVLASRLSIKPETLSRILSHLKQDKIINVMGNQIILRDVDALKEYMNDLDQL